MRLGKEKMILGLPWLRAHNPEVNWVTGEVKMSRCPEKCSLCREEVCEERKEARKEAQRIRACRMGPFPKTTVEEVDDEGDDLAGEEEEEAPEEEQEEKETVEDGDRIFMTAIKPEEQHIRATGNFSQQLAEAFHCNSETKSFRDASGLPTRLSRCVR